MADNTPHITWLHEQLPALVKAGVLSEETAQRLRDHYPATRASSNWATILFGILGTVLIGGGIILLIAHNWEQMSRPMRVVLAFGPLLAAQALAFWVLWTGNQSTAWRESVGTAVALLVGACIALVSQTYNLGGNFGTFMLVWTLLSLPVAYLLRATLPALWFIIATVIWVFNTPYGSHDRVWFFPLLLLIVPLWWMEHCAGPARQRPALLAFALSVAAALGIGAVSERLTSDWLSFAGGSSVAAFLFLFARSGIPSATVLTDRPFHWLGFLGVVGISITQTFTNEGWLWRHTDPLAALWEDWPKHTGELIAILIWIATALALWVRCLLTRRDHIGALVGAAPLLMLIIGIIGPDSTTFITILMNAYVLAIGIVALVRGLRTQRLSVVNAGLLTIASLVLCRFFDSDLGFVVRAVVFIGLGIGFLVTNLLIVRKHKQGATP